jgi:hypothetical protein
VQTICLVVVFQKTTHVSQTRQLLCSLQVQCAAKTRQLWQLREQHEREVRRLQDQLSVVRASLLQHLAHKAALELKVKQQSIHGVAIAAAAAAKLKVVVAGQQSGADASHSGAAAAQLQDDVPLVADGSPKRRGRSVQVDQADRLSRAASPNPVFQGAAAGIAAADAQVASDSSASTAEVDATAAEQHAHAATPDGINSMLRSTGAAAAQQGEAGDMDSYAQTAAVSASSAAVLLTAAAKLQRLVEQLTQREPAVAADLSLLQWQLTTTFGSMTGAPSRSGEVVPLLQQSSSSTPDAAESTAADEEVSAAVNEASNSSSSSEALQDAPMTPAGSVKLQPADTHPLAEDAAAAAAAAAAGHPAQHSAAEVAAAARLFSGAATTLQAPSIDWYYLEEGGSVRGALAVSLLNAPLQPWWG